MSLSDPLGLIRPRHADGSRSNEPRRWRIYEINHAVERVAAGAEMARSLPVPSASHTPSAKCSSNREGESCLPDAAGAGTRLPFQSTSDLRSNGRS